MAPILLKVKGNTESLPFGNLDSPDDLSKTWRVCTKVKDSLENGSRLENLSWRLWFAHNVNQKKKKFASPTVSFKIPDDFDFNRKKKKKTIQEKEIEYRRNLKLQQQKQAQHILQEQFTLQKFTSDQAGDQVIELDDIFKNYLIPSTTPPHPQQQSHQRQHPSTQQQLNSESLMHQSWPIEDYSLSCMQNYSQQQAYCNQSSALYVSAETMPPIPIGTLHNRLLATLPRETLESAERLLLSSTDNEMLMQSSQQPCFIQSTPNTPFLSFSSSSSSSFVHQPQLSQLSQQQQHLSPQQQLPQRLPQQLPQPPVLLNQPSYHSYTQSSLTVNTETADSIPYQSKSLPPSRAPSPTSHSPSPSSPLSVKKNSYQKRGLIHSSPADGKIPICSNCSTTTTPLWRRSADDELLCNACGLYLKLHNAPRPKHLKPQSSRKDARDDDHIVQPVCSNCGTSTTPLWRRDVDGSPLCNACGLYLKLHHEKRPLSMKTDNIKKRQRSEHSSSQDNKSKEKKKSGNKHPESQSSSSSKGTTTYQFMEGIIHTSKNESNTEHAHFSTFGINQFNCKA
ncbi:hypothetical protein BCV72DRAFT_286264 [Rhizopus microsporus var. microsporus]|uniref:GATA-type domain-containing protein n=2 Tax=Rhizopus microsporus TaxID=58291 RepID=A0A2G4T4M2_RHIZD|nr:uncharacterized protein RHIMIDRAFT_264674 [Rhizopus microsporus ATCC 52813]ORE10162.1 hypothetical protein BCV72DRAFT_286264 [Rhizopus microsporus var. microsporus]PHZ15962.1 hypothetical protein RHIMIDRAFT_264674 [Rhizopus microsporus ATCC 52813]